MGKLLRRATAGVAGRRESNEDVGENNQKIRIYMYEVIKE